MDESSDVDMAAERLGRRVRSAQQWRELIEAHVASGLGVKVYCRQQGITSSCFYRWRRILAAGGGTSPGARQAASAGGVFAQVRVWDELWAGQVMSLRLRGGRELLLPLSMPVDRLVALVVALEKTGGPS